MSYGVKVGIICVVVAAAMIVIYGSFDPMTTAWMPKCMLHQLTGLQCPGCGSQRVVYALLHGDIAAAWRANAFLLCALPLLAAMFAIQLLRERCPRLYARVWSPTAVTVVLMLIIAWWIVRNILAI